jgi:hypothetical protein
MSVSSSPNPYTISDQLKLTANFLKRSERRIYLLVGVRGGNLAAQAGFAFGDDGGKSA